MNERQEWQGQRREAGTPRRECVMVKERKEWQGQGSVAGKSGKGGV